ncbi:MAG: hypothetical protein ABJN04_05250 [Hyphomicrobiales bacterium]
MEWRKVQRFYFVIYSVLIGPPLGLLLLLLVTDLNQLVALFSHSSWRPPIFYLIGAYFVGALQAFVTAVLIIWWYAYSEVLTVWALLGCSVIGWLFGSWLNYYFAFDFLFNEHFVLRNSTVELGIIAPLVFGVLMTFLLWYLRPKKWVGP